MARILRNTDGSRRWRGHVVSPTDWIITGAKGEHYPCKAEIFEMTYEPVRKEPSPSRSEVAMSVTKDLADMRKLSQADAIADVVGSGRTLRQHGLVAFGDTLCDSEAVLISRAGVEPDKAARQFVARVQGVVIGQQYVMIDYDCPRSLLERASAITPGIESPTVAPMADPDWVAVRAMVPRKQHQNLMDELAELGAKAILATDIRSCRF